MYFDSFEYGSELIPLFGINGCMVLFVFVAVVCKVCYKYVLHRPCIVQKYFDRLLKMERGTSASTQFTRHPKPPTPSNSLILCCNFQSEKPQNVIGGLVYEDVV